MGSSKVMCKHKSARVVVVTRTVLVDFSAIASKKLGARCSYRRLTFSLLSGILRSRLGLERGDYEGDFSSLQLHRRPTLLVVSLTFIAEVRSPSFAHSMHPCIVDLNLTDSTSTVALAMLHYGLYMKDKISVLSTCTLLS